MECASVSISAVGQDPGLWIYFHKLDDMPLYTDDAYQQWDQTGLFACLCHNFRNRSLGGLDICFLHAVAYDSDLSIVCINGSRNWN